MTQPIIRRTYDHGRLCFAPEPKKANHFPAHALSGVCALLALLVLFLGAEAASRSAVLEAAVYGFTVLLAAGVAALLWYLAHEDQKRQAPPT